MRIFLPWLAAAGWACKDAIAFNLTILHMNDHHSNLEGDDFDVDVADLPFNLSDSTIEEVTIPYGGFGRIKSVLDSYSTTNDNVLKLHAGDALVGTPIYSIFQAEADAALMRELCFDAFCLGNHEFDDGDSNLFEFISMLRSSDQCSTAVLGANVLPGESSPLRSLQESGLLSKSQVLQFTDDEQVGIVGINIRNKTLLSSRPDEGTTLSDERETARAEVEALVAAGIDKIVLLTHIGYDLDLEWMVDIPNVDVIVGGDSHTLLGENGVFEAAAPYPAMQTSSDGRTVCVVQAWEFAHGFGKLDVEFDDNGEVIKCSGHPVFPIGTPELSDADEAMKVTDYLVSLGDSFIPAEEDPSTMLALEGFTGQLSGLLAETIATVPEDICFERIPGQGRSTICPAEASEEQGGGVCNLVAQAFLAQTLEAQVAIQNGGGCRTDIAAGNFTYDDAYNLLPFSNTLVLLDMTGAEIKLVLEQALENALVSGSSGAYPYAAGLRFDVNANEALGSRVSNLEVNVRLGGAWDVLAMEETYRVVTNDFIAAGRDGYLVFADVEDVVDTQTAYAQTFIDFAIEEGELLDPSLDTYSTKSFVALGEDPPIVESGEWSNILVVFGIILSIVGVCLA